MVNKIRHRSPFPALSRAIRALWPSIVLLTLVAAISAVAQAQTYTLLYSFTGAHGNDPWSGVILDNGGNVYGTTNTGGNYTACKTGCGVVYTFSPAGKEKVLHKFTSTPDGFWPTFGSLLRMLPATSTGQLAMGVPEPVALSSH